MVDIVFFSKPFTANTQMWELTWPIDTQFNDKNEMSFQTLYDQYRKGVDIRKNALRQSQRIINVFVKNATKESSLDWLKEFFSHSQSKDIIVHPLYDLDPNKLDTNKLPRGIILIGDAIHPMSPYKGMGANEAMWDAYLLSKLLVEQQNLEFSDMDNEMKKFYKELKIRTSRSVLRSREITGFYHWLDAVDVKKLYKFKKWSSSTGLH